MKKILYLVAVAIVSFILSGYIYPTTIKGKVKSNDSTEVTMNVNVTAKNIGPYKIESNGIFEEALRSTIEVNKIKSRVLESLEKEPKVEKEIIPTTGEYLLEKYGFSKEIITRRIRADTIIKSVSTIVIIILMYILISIIYERGIRSKIELWKFTLLKIFFVFLLLITCQLYLYNILTYIFNREFLIIKEILKLLT